MDVEKLKTKIDERRRWNMEHMRRPNLVNNGLIQALALIEAAESDVDFMPMGSSFIAYSRERIHEIASDPKNVVLDGSDEFVSALAPMGYPGDVIDVVYPDGVEEICVEMSIARAMVAGFGKRMLEKGTFTQEEYEAYLENPWMEHEDNRIEIPETDNIVSLFQQEAQ